MPKHAVIVVALNGIENTVKCVESVLANSKDFELIVVENLTTDGTLGYLWSKEGAKLVRSDVPRSFAENNNIGLLAVSPDVEFVTFLNNDTVVCKDWLIRMENHFYNVPMDKVGAVGPVTNMSNGRQMVGLQDPEKWHQENHGVWKHAGVLYGWCMMVRKSILDRIGGFDERFLNSWEDNDLSLRIQLDGWNLIIAYDTFIWHKGQGTLRTQWTTEQYAKNGAEMRDVFFDKYWTPEKKKKLVAVYRTNGGAWLEKSLEQTSKFADSIIIHFCRSLKRLPVTAELESLPGIKEIVHVNRNIYVEDLITRFPKIKKVGFYDGVFQEDYERGWLLEEAQRLREAGEADWCISVDDDEIYEDKFIDRVQAMMNPRNPHIMGYWCEWRTIWETRLGIEYFRQDSTFGSFTNYRFFKLLPGQKIMSRHPEGHHCGSAPWIADENLAWSNVRVKHMGYDTPEQRQKKYEFYEKNDHFKTRADIGFDDYSHLISLNPKLEEYRADHGVSCIMMLKNEEDHILACLENIQPMIDEFVLVNTGSTDKTFDIIQKFAQGCAVPVKILEYPWDDNYSRPRNFGKLHATKPWIMFMDADERFQPEHIRTLSKMTETNADVIVLNVMNYLESPMASRSPKVAMTQAARLFRNEPEFYFSGVIHETVDDSLSFLRRNRKVNAVMAPVSLHHYGYLKDKSKLKAKLEYYEGLNNRQIEITEGKDPRPFFNLALHFLESGDQKKALEYLHKSLSINPKFWHAAREIGVMNLQSARSLLLQALGAMPEGYAGRQAFIDIINAIDGKSQGFTKVA